MSVMVKFLIWEVILKVGVIIMWKKRFWKIIFCIWKVDLFLGSDVLDLN